MKETDKIINMIKEEGIDFFWSKGKYKINVGVYLEHLMEERGITRKELIYRLNLDESYGRKILGGQRIPTRKILLQCGILFGLKLEELQRLLDIGGKARLYPRERYDAALIYGIEKGMTLEEMNNFLEEIGEEPIL